MARVRSIGVICLTAATAAATGCTEPEGRPPLARIELVPEAIPENDGSEKPRTSGAERNASLLPRSPPIHRKLGPSSSPSWYSLPWFVA